MAERRRLLGPIAVRLALATVVVAIGAVGVLSVLTLVAARGDVSQLARQQQDQGASATATVVTDAYRAAGSWNAAHLRAAVALASDNQATLTVIDSSGRAVPLPEASGSPPPRVLEGPLRDFPVVVGGRNVGRVLVHFYRANLPIPETHLRDALVRTVAAGAGLGVLLALAVAVVLSRWITRPVVALTEAARSMTLGDREVRVEGNRGRGELAELATAFNNMADTIAHEEELRRAVVTDVAHELRTPLAILQASTENLAEGTVDPTRAEMASLHDEVLRLGRIIDDLDTLASAEASILSLHVRAFDLSKVASRTIEAMRPLYRAAGVELQARLNPAQALVDTDRSEQILANLLTNALKFTDPGGRVTVTVEPDTEVVIMEVSDTGTGIPADELPRVFERFWRGAQAGRVAGSGIGLAVVNTLVQAHGGEIDVGSEPSAGTRFTVRLPRA